jgi:hypothetical protein
VLSYTVVQRSAYSGSLHRQIGATSNTSDMVWLTLLTIAVVRWRPSLFFIHVDY